MSKVKTHLFTFERHRLIAGVFIVLFLALGMRLEQLQIASHAFYFGQTEGQHLDTGTPALRGEIKIMDKLTPEPIAVATNIELPLIYAVPKNIKDPLVTSKLLAPLLKMDEQTLLTKLSDKSKVYVPLAKGVVEKDLEAITKLNLTGINTDTETARFYPEGTLLAHVLGFVGYRSDTGSGKVGVYGLERKYDALLVGKPGGTTGSRFKNFFSSQKGFIPAKNGSQLVLTIDRLIQLQAEQVLSKAVEDNQADGGCVSVMDPKTGAVLAMASNPTYNLNEYSKVQDESNYINSCTTSNYESGSVFKAVTMAAGIDTGKVGPDTTYNDTGQVVVDGYTIKNSDNKGHGLQTMSQVLEESLNTGVIFVKQKLGNKTFLDYVKRFGFGQNTGVDLPESSGNIKNLDGNIEVNFDTASFGQGISVTPLQLLRAYSAIANGGRLPTPYVVASQVSPSGETIDTKPKLSDQIISTKTASTLSAMLVGVVERGHGKRAGVKGYYVAGKTGTAQVAKSDGRGYDPTNNIGTFVGFAPVEDPKFVMIVRVNHPRTVQFAESTAAPAWGKLAQFLLSYYNVVPNRQIK